MARRENVTGGVGNHEPSTRPAGGGPGRPNRLGNGYERARAAGGQLLVAGREWGGRAAEAGRVAGVRAAKLGKTAGVNTLHIAEGATIVARELARDPQVVLASVNGAIDRTKEVASKTKITLLEARQQLRDTRDRIYRETVWRTISDLDTRTTHYLTAASSDPNIHWVEMSQVTKALKNRMVSPYDVPRDSALWRRQYMPMRANRDLLPVQRAKAIGDRMFERQNKEIISGRPGGILDLVRARKDFQAAIRLDLPGKKEMGRLRDLARIDAIAVAREGARVGGLVPERQATVQRLHALGDKKYAMVLGERLRRSDWTVYHQSEQLRTLLGKGLGGRAGGEQIVERLYRLGDIEGAVKGEKLLRRRYGLVA
jgi:hypothetical protein